MVSPKRSIRSLELPRHKFQIEFCKLARTKRICAFIGGLQGGKTVAGADALAELLWDEDVQLPEQARDSYPEVWILSRTHDLAKVAWGAFTDRWGDMVFSANDCKRKGLHRGDYSVHWLRPGPRRDGKPIRLRLRTVEDPENLRGTQNLLVAWADEAAYWKEMAWLNLLGRGIVSNTRYLITTTPKGKNWLYRDVVVPSDQGDQSIAYVTCRSIDNPWASKEYLQLLRMKYGEEYAKQELDALFVDNAGMVYSFDRIQHMRTPPSMNPQDYEQIVFGVDPGYGDPYAVGVWGRTLDGVWWLLEEFYRPKVITSDLVPWFHSRVTRYNPRAIYVDKRRPSDWLELKKAGFPAQPNIEVHGESDRRVIMPQIRMCQQLLRSGLLFINKSCVWTAEEFESYHFRDNVDEKNPGENPIDWKNHQMDAMRYAICSVEEGAKGPMAWKRDRFGGMSPMGRRQRDPREPIHIPDIHEYLKAQDIEWERKLQEKLN